MDPFRRLLDGLEIPDYFQEVTNSKFVVLFSKLKNNVKTEITFFFCGNSQIPHVAMSAVYEGGELLYRRVIQDVCYEEIAQSLKNRT